MKFRYQFGTQYMFEIILGNVLLRESLLPGITFDPLSKFTQKCHQQLSYSPFTANFKLRSCVAGSLTSH